MLAQQEMDLESSLVAKHSLQVESRLPVGLTVAPAAATLPGLSDSESATGRLGRGAARQRFTGMIYLAAVANLS